MAAPTRRPCSSACAGPRCPQTSPAANTPGTLVRPPSSTRTPQPQRTDGTRGADAGSIVVAEERVHVVAAGGVEIPPGAQAQQRVMPGDLALGSAGDREHAAVVLGKPAEGRRTGEDLDAGLACL